MSNPLRTDSPPPVGVVTFLFTDIEGQHAPVGATPPTRCRRHLRVTTRSCATGIEKRGGHVFKTAGDAFYAAFAHRRRALDARWRCSRRFRRALAGGDADPGADGAASGEARVARWRLFRAAAQRASRGCCRRAAAGRRC